MFLSMEVSEGNRFVVLPRRSLKRKWTHLHICNDLLFLTRGVCVLLPMELTLLGGPPMLEGALCFMELMGPSLVAAAAAAGTCGEVGGELGDLLSVGLGLADRFSGCAPSLSCKNQNSTVSLAVTTARIWRRAEGDALIPPQIGTNWGGGTPCMAVWGRPDGMTRWQGACHCLSSHSSAQTQIQMSTCWCKPLTFTCKIADFLSPFSKRRFMHMQVQSSHAGSSRHAVRSCPSANTRGRKRTLSSNHTWRRFTQERRFLPHHKTRNFFFPLHIVDTNSFGRLNYIKHCDNFSTTAFK